ncbi:MAG: FmdB family transcriptional regulator [Desulfatitalea sp. BRH_c12]|nr:MAG: FmdB family transcriptional regulator [Desulfatitalea sp. BRH_c12]
MPIYEFKCLECQEFMEILVMGADDKQVEMKCQKCGSESLERILSTTSYCVAGGSAAQSGPSTESRTCSGGSCNTWNLPGHAR